MGGRVITGSNFSPRILSRLGAALGETPEPDKLFDVIVCLLSASAYAHRFGNSLEDELARVPFPREKDAFDAAAVIGAKIKAIQTFSGTPDAKYRTARIVGVASSRQLEMPKQRHAFSSIDNEVGEIALQTGADHRVTGVRQKAWKLEVSGYAIIYRWLEHRQGRPLDQGLYRELLDVVARVEALVDLYAAADKVLVATLQSVLTRDELGLSEAR